jgi:hypothetical protein
VGGNGGAAEGALLNCASTDIHNVVSCMESAWRWRCLQCVMVCHPFGDQQHHKCCKQEVNLSQPTAGCPVTLGRVLKGDIYNRF